MFSSRCNLHISYKKFAYGKNDINLKTNRMTTFFEEINNSIRNNSQIFVLWLNTITQ